MDETNQGKMGQAGIPTTGIFREGDSARISSAHLSLDLVYRYTLTRIWSLTGNPLIVLGLNPSKADGSVNDPTIHRECHFARAWGHSGIIALNLYAYRATDPHDLQKAQAENCHVIGPENDHFLRANCGGRRVLCAWGAHPMVDVDHRAARVVELLRPLAASLVCLGLTKDGYPLHPLARGKHRVPNDARPLPFPPGSSP